MTFHAASPVGADSGPSSLGRLGSAISGARAIRVAFYLTVTYAGLVFWFARHPPMADLPQHAAQIAVLRDLLLEASPWHELVRINPITPYLIGYALALPLAMVLPIAFVMKLLLSLCFYAFVAAGLLLRRHLRADERLDWLFIPGFFGVAYVWGFFTFLLATPIGLALIYFASRHAGSPTLRRAVAVSLTGLMLFFSHGLVFIFTLAIGMGILAVRQRSWGGVLRGLVPYVPLLLVSIIYTIYVHANETPLDNGPAVTLWGDIRLRLAFLHNIFGNTGESLLDRLFPATAGAFMLWSARMLGLRPQWHQPAALVPLVMLALVWIAAPFYALKTTFVFNRFSIFVLPFVALAFCREIHPAAASAARRRRAFVVQALLALICWSFLAAQTQRIREFDVESRDFETVRSGLVPAQRALYVALDSESPAAANNVAYYHHALWYQAENRGWVDYNFAWTLSQVVRYRTEHVPSVRPFWNPRQFDPVRDEIWRYRYLFVRHPLPLSAAFAEGGHCELRLLRASGHWSVFEVAKCPVRAE